MINNGIRLDSKNFTSNRFYDILINKFKYPLKSSQLVSIWNSWKLIQFIHDLFALFYLFVFCQDVNEFHSIHSLLYLFFILHCSSLRFIVWNVISTEITNILIQLPFQKFWTTWERILLHPPHSVIEKEISQSFQVMPWRMIVYELIINSDSSFTKQHLFTQIVRQPTIWIWLIQMWIDLIGTWVLLPKYLSLLFFLWGHHSMFVFA